MFYVEDASIPRSAELWSALGGDCLANGDWDYELFAERLQALNAAAQDDQMQTMPSASSLPSLDLPSTAASIAKAIVQSPPCLGVPIFEHDTPGPPRSAVEIPASRSPSPPRSAVPMSTSRSPSPPQSAVILHPSRSPSPPRSAILMSASSTPSPPRSAVYLSRSPSLSPPRSAVAISRPPSRPRSAMDISPGRLSPTSHSAAPVADLALLCPVIRRVDDQRVPVDEDMQTVSIDPQTDIAPSDETRK